MSRRFLRIGISGSYGGLNLGDEAILEGILRELRASVDAEVTVFSRNPEDTRRRHAVQRVVAVRDLTRDEVEPEVARLDLFILGGGGLLYDASAMTYLREVLIAEELGVPVVIYAVSAGPLRQTRVRDELRQAMDGVAALTVRDRRSKLLLQEVGIHRDIHVTADPALLVPVDPPSEELLERENLSGDHALIGISVREPGEAAPDLDVAHYHQLLANAADFMINRYDASLVFVPLERQVKDVQHSHAVIAGMAYPQRATVLKQDYSVRELVSLMGWFEFTLGMRLHFLIFSALQRVPFLALPYGSKVAGLLDEFGMEMPQLEDINAGQLLSYIDRAWDLRGALRARIEAELAPLQARARETNAIVMDVLSRVTTVDEPAVRGEHRPQAARVPRPEA